MRFNQNISPAEYADALAALQTFKTADKSQLKRLDELSRLSFPAIKALETITFARGNQRFNPTPTYIEDYLSVFSGHFYFFDKHARSRLVIIGMDNSHLVITNHPRIRNKKTFDQSKYDYYLVLPLGRSLLTDSTKIAMATKDWAQNRQTYLPGRFPINSAVAQGFAKVLETAIKDLLPTL